MSIERWKYDAGKNYTAYYGNRCIVVASWGADEVDEHEGILRFITEPIDTGNRTYELTIGLDREHLTTSIVSSLVTKIVINRTPETAANLEIVRELLISKIGVDPLSCVTTFLFPDHTPI